MIRGLAAKYLFAACLSASVVDLVIADFVLGPLALQPPSPPGMASPTPSTPPPPDRAEVAAAPRVAAPTATATAVVSATPSATTLPTTRPRSRVVARFDSDQQAANEDDLRALAKAMIADPSAEIVLEGHTDQRGDAARNRTLSLDRATWAKGRLVELGVNPSRIAVVGLGAERPLGTGDDDASIASNRRVEVRWLSGSPMPPPAPSSTDGDR